MSTVLLTAFTCGWMTLPLSFFLDGEEGRIRCPATAYLIDHPKGLAVFDTGLGSRFERPVGTPFQKGADLESDALIGARLKAIGIDPSAVKWIINSHLHSDHAGGNRDLPNATIVVQADEWDYAFAEKDRAYHIPEFDTGQPVLKLRGEHDLHGDGSVVLFRSPGHTPGHQCARVTTPTGIAVLAADCCNLRRSLDELRLPDHCFDVDQYLATLKILRERERRGERIFFGHDPDFWAEVPQNRPLDFAARR
ncbi:N-acyl homoserine lactonase family protein [Sphingopyxis terrae]|uniref:N-acyl homoserine lactonase family protein n=1 Tax=Sphingopyxis terrae TaxID=33052 RepID=UPI002A0B1F05|nr:N-acyl homoserine lactonase family protein [Sphingopyxis terrae]MDX8356420.1 N-acyl homoserine lactonase family protein [Sphingopyxis terrae]